MCTHDTTTKGMLRGVCESCQLNVFVAAHNDKVAMEYSLRFDVREDELNRRERDVEEQEQGLELVRLIKEVVRGY